MNLPMVTKYNRESANGLFTPPNSLFHDQYKTAHAFVDGETFALRSKTFQSLLRRALFLTYHVAPRDADIKRLVAQMECTALFEGPLKRLVVRVGQAKGVFFYDLLHGEAVRVSPGAWEVVPAPILFRRHSHQRPQVQPVRNGDPWAIFDFVNIAEPDRLLFLVATICSFVPDIVHPALALFGGEGTGKSMAFCVVKRLVDPSLVDVLIAPKKLLELTQVLSHHYFSPLDNLSAIPESMSNLLAQAITGGGFSKRRLYTNDEDIIYELKRCIGVGGINLLITNPDLMDRALLFPLKEIGEKLSELELLARFEESRPHILGGIFDVLARAMALYPQVQVSELPRLADFYQWGCAIAEALGGMGSQFQEAFLRNIASKGAQLVHGDAFLEAVLRFMHRREVWRGYVKDAWEILARIAGPDARDASFPKSPRMLRQSLGRIRGTLDKNGITCTISDRHDEKGFPISFRKAGNLVQMLQATEKA